MSGIGMPAYAKTFKASSQFARRARAARCVVCVVLLGLTVAGCDKCGGWIFDRSTPTQSCKGTGPQ